MLDVVVDTCRCSHLRTAHAIANGMCHSCSCGGFNAEDPKDAACRIEAWHELIEHVATLDRRYSKLPKLPW